MTPTSSLLFPASSEELPPSSGEEGISKAMAGTGFFLEERTRPAVDVFVIVVVVILAFIPEADDAREGVPSGRKREVPWGFGVLEATAALVKESAERIGGFLTDFGVPTFKLLPAEGVASAGKSGSCKLTRAVRDLAAVRFFGAWPTDGVTRELDLVSFLIMGLYSRSPPLPPSPPSSLTSE